MHASFLVALFFIVSAVSPAVSIPLGTWDSSCGSNSNPLDGLPLGFGDDCDTISSFQPDPNGGNNVECSHIGCK